MFPMFTPTYPREAVAQEAVTEINRSFHELALNNPGSIERINQVIQEKLATLTSIWDESKTELARLQERKLTFYKIAFSGLGLALIQLFAAATVAAGEVLTQREKPIQPAGTLCLSIGYSFVLIGMVLDKINMFRSEKKDKIKDLREQINHAQSYKLFLDSLRVVINPTSSNLSLGRCLEAYKRLPFEILSNDKFSQFISLIIERLPEEDPAKIALEKLFSHPEAQEALPAAAAVSEDDTPLPHLFLALPPELQVFQESFNGAAAAAATATSPAARRGRGMASSVKTPSSGSERSGSLPHEPYNAGSDGASNPAIETTASSTSDDSVRSQAMAALAQPPEEKPIAALFQDVIEHFSREFSEDIRNIPFLERGGIRITRDGRVSYLRGSEYTSSVLQVFAIP